MPVIPETLKTMLADTPPFGADDVTVGIEHEWQVCVAGDPGHIDLVQTILTSNHYRNLVKRSASGDVPGHTLRALDKWLHENESRIWENSWVRFPLHVLNASASTCLDRDMLADKTRPEGPRRTDAGRFFIDQQGTTFLRVPVSYLLKLALLQAVGSARTPELVRRIAFRIESCFLNDNTSPEICSFYPIPLFRDPEPGRAAAKEAMRRYLLTQLLTAYSNRAMQLGTHGQRVMVYAAPHPPVRQKALNNLISDVFYRDLFMSPCLSGWNDGEAKHRYMHLCHEVLSRSQLNAVLKMREAGIIQNNLVVLPSLSNTSLANNGIHISIGSSRITRWMRDPESGFGAAEERNTGDLATKIVEYFLPLFVGTFSAAPYKLDFMDFHPEKVLGFLPHELSHTHMRMLWRRWKKKGRFKVFGRALTPFGPEWLDRLVNRVFRFKGDFVPDFRLLDYPVALLSTDQSPGLDGHPGNDKRLLDDLMSQGAFDHRMPMYRLWRLREFGRMGFSGFEARYYSQFADTLGDMAHAVCLQTLLAAMAYRYMARGLVTHDDIPDTPHAESERRQVFFGSAIGLPTFYVRRESCSGFMKRLLERVEHTRPSRRYPGYIRVKSVEYRKALVRVIREDAASLVESLKAGPALDALEARIELDNSCSAVARLSSGIRNQLGDKPVHRCAGDEFNSAAECYYRETLRRRETEQAVAVMEQDIPVLLEFAETCPDVHQAIQQCFPDCSPAEDLAALKAGLLEETLDDAQMERMIHLLLLIIHAESVIAERQV
jgi:hypothetical protein